MSATSDKLWLTVMKAVVAIDASQQKKWKEASEKTCCEFCKEPEGAVLISCAAEKCSKQYHIDCAFQLGGLTMEDNGIIHFHCDSHLKPVLFCTCKEKYDEMKAMVFCDSCFDWFHDSCEKLDPAVAQNMEKYNCNNCKYLISQGKSVSKADQSKNLEKEYRSSCQQNANKIVGLLVELSGSVCPFLDRLTTTSSNDQYSTADIEEFLNFLKSPPFINSKEEQDEDVEKWLAKTGVQELSQLWAVQISSYIERFKIWEHSVRDGFSKQRIEKSLTFSQLGAIRDYLETMMHLATSLSAEFRYTLKNVSGFYAYVDALKWIFDFLQVI